MCLRLPKFDLLYRLFFKSYNSAEYILYYVILPLHNMSEGNVALSAPLHLSDSFSFSPR